MFLHGCVHSVTNGTHNACSRSTFTKKCRSQDVEFLGLRLSSLGPRKDTVEFETF